MQFRASPTSPCRPKILAAFFGCLVSLLVSASAQDTAGTGAIQGRVHNESSGAYLNNARVVVPGTTFETSTDAAGFYRLHEVPAGEMSLEVSYVGLKTQTAAVAVRAGEIVHRDFTMRLGGAARTADGEKIIELDAFTVTDRQLSGRASALQEQKNAANIKNVIAFDEFGEMGEGNVAEYLKFTPGLDINYSPQVPLYMSIRGMPAAGTVVTLNGASSATTIPGVARNFDFSLSATANIDRVEITKTPTPDLPANAVGGSINIITKSGFSQARPVLKYNVYLTHDELEGLDHLDPSFGTSVGPDSFTTRRDIRPSFNLSLIRPLNDKLAFTFSANFASRKMDWNYFTPTWDRVRLVQTANAVNNTAVYRENDGVSASLDWKITPNDMLTFSVQHSGQDTEVRSHTFTLTLGAGNTGGPDFSQGAATGVGTIGRNYTANTQVKFSESFGVRYKHQGSIWNYDALLNYNKGTYDSFPRGGYMTGAATTNSLNGNLIIRFDGLTGLEHLRNPVYSATDRAGQPVDVYRGDTLSLTQTNVVNNSRDHEVFNGGFNVDRKFDLAVPVSIKFGGLYDTQYRYMSGDTQQYAFNPPTGAAGRLLSGYDVFATDYSNRGLTVDVAGNAQNPMHLSMQKVYDNLFNAHPDWFTLDQAARYINWVNNRRDLEESISAGYFRTDVRLLNNRLWLIGGVRYERTEDKGAGPKDDISAIYRRNPDGSFVRTAAGALVPITTNALEQAQLRYTSLGTRSTKSYDGFYPSMNASYEITSKLIARAAYARTIGRPDLTEIIPGATISTPDAAIPVIEVTNSALEPWTANNYDLTLESYDIKGASTSVSLFQKDVSKFFATDTVRATQSIVESYGLVWDDSYSTYDLVTKRNAGDATIRGIELSYRQSLTFDSLPAWLQRFQFYVNYTRMEVSGPDADSFSFSPERTNYGFGYYGKKFAFNVNVADGAEIRQEFRAANSTTPAGTYRFQREYPRIDLSTEYNFTKRLGVYASVRNIQGSPQRNLEYAPGSTPDYARPRQYLYAGAQISVGVKGEW